MALATDWHWLLVPLAYGFVARTLAGPRLSPLALFATRVVAPRLGAPKEVAGPPKRFAQAIGAVHTTVGAILSLAFGLEGVTAVLLGVLVVAATLESVFAYCIGCKAFALLVRAGVVSPTVCAECADISGRGSSGWPRRRPPASALATCRG